MLAFFVIERNHKGVRNSVKCTTLDFFTWMGEVNLGDLKVEIKVIYDEHEGRYGYRRIGYELGSRGQKVNQ